MRQIKLNRQKLGVEDLLFGTGTEEQTRGNQQAVVTKINAGNLPFDETRSLIEFAQATNLEGLGNSVEAINNLNNNLDKLLIVEDNLPIINNVEALKESIVTLDTNILALQNIDTNMSSINTVEDNLPDVVSVAQNIVPNLTEILNVDTLAAQVTQDKSDVSSMKLAVETIYDTFDDRFLGAKIVDPTLDNDGNALIDGAMYFNTSSNTMKVYDVGTTTWYSIPQIYLSALLDVQLTSITSGNVLRWNGTKWINYTLSKSDVELNLVDNTADSAKNVLSSTKLTTARTINGVSFDGSANIIVSDSTAVKLTGNETIAGVKTFNSSPIVPTPTTNTQAVNKAYVDSAYSGFKNYIINGGLDVWQRGTSGSVEGYKADRWRDLHGGAQSWSRSTDVPSGIGAKYSIKYNGQNNLVYFTEAEVSKSLKGKTAVISCWMKTSIACSAVTIQKQNAFEGGFTGGYSNIAGVVIENISSHTGGGTWQKVVTRYIFPNTSEMDNGLVIGNIAPSGGTDSFATQVQLEEGSVATPFEQRPIGLELSLCQRYYQKIAWSDRKTATAAGQYLHQSIRLPVDMRVTPTATNINVGQVVNATFIGIAIFSNIHVRAEAHSNVAGDSYVLNRVDSLSAEL